MSFISTDSFQTAAILLLRHRNKLIVPRGGVRLLWGVLLEFSLV